MEGGQQKSFTSVREIRGHLEKVGHHVSKPIATSSTHVGNSCRQAATRRDQPRVMVEGCDGARSFRFARVGVRDRQEQLLEVALR